jgi:hypothetical protein
VVGLRFDCSEITQSLSEVAAYGTAVRLIDEQASTGQTADDAMSDRGDVDPMSDTADVDAMSDTAEHDFSPGWSEQFETRPGSNPP